MTEKKELSQLNDKEIIDFSSFPRFTRRFVDKILVCVLYRIFLYYLQLMALSNVRCSIHIYLFIESNKANYYFTLFIGINKRRMSVTSNIQKKVFFRIVLAHIGFILYYKLNVLD